MVGSQSSRNTRILRQELNRGTVTLDFHKRFCKISKKAIKLAKISYYQERIASSANKSITLCVIIDNSQNGIEWTTKLKDLKKPKRK